MDAILGLESSTSASYRVTFLNPFNGTFHNFRHIKVPALTIPSFSFAFPCSTAKVVLRCHGRVFCLFFVVHVRGPCQRCRVASVVRSLEDVACKSKKKQKPGIRSARSRAPYVMKETRLRLWQHGEDNAVSLTPNKEPPTSHSNACEKRKEKYIPAISRFHICWARCRFAFRREDTISLYGTAPVIQHVTQS